MHGDDVASTSMTIMTDVTVKGTEVFLEIMKVAIDRERKAKLTSCEKTKELSGGETTFKRLKEGGEVKMIPSFPAEDYGELLRRAKKMDIPVAAMQEKGKDKTLSVFINVMDEAAINAIMQDIVREKLRQPEQTERMITIEKDQVEAFQTACAAQDIPVTFMESKDGVKCIFSAAYEKKIQAVVSDFQKMQSELSHTSVTIEQDKRGRPKIVIEDTEQGKKLSMNFCTKAKLERVLQERLGFSETKAIQTANALTANLSEQQRSYYLSSSRTLEQMKLLKKAEVKEGSDDFQSDLDLIFDALEHPETYTHTVNPSDKMRDLNLIDLAKSVKSPASYMCLKYYKDFKKAAGDTAKSILISTAVRLQAFNIPEVMDLTSCDNMHLEMLGDEKTAMFIIIPSSDDTFNFLAAMMYTQLFDVLYDRANFKHGGRLPVHVRCLLDEFANLGQIPRFEELLATMRSMEISANVIIQNLSQLKKMYKDSWENVLGNCDSLLFLGGQEPTTLEHISKMLGKKTIDTRSQNRTRGKNGSTSENDGILGRELMTVDELKVMRDDECILFVRGIYPFFCHKFQIEKHPNYALLEDANKANAYQLSDRMTVKSEIPDDTEEADLYTEPADETDANDTPEKEIPIREDAYEKQTDVIEQSVTLEDIRNIGTQPNSFVAGKEIPKSPANGGSEPARLDENDRIVTAAPEASPASAAVDAESEFDVFDDL